MREIVLEKRFGFIKIASVSPRVIVGNPQRNVERILESLHSPELEQASVIVFPELSVSGYTCGDLFFQDTIVSASKRALEWLCRALENDPRLVAVGVPVLKDGKLFNCAAVLCNGSILGFIPKIHIPNYQEFYEKRWFFPGKDYPVSSIYFLDKEVPFGTNFIFSHLGVKIGVEICEDLWVPTPPSSNLAQHGAEIILNLSATDDNIGKYDYIRSLVASQSARCRCAYVYASAGEGESSTDLVFSGINLIAYDGDILSQSQRFSPDHNFALADVDVEKIRNDRRKYSSFYADSASDRFITVHSNAQIHPRGYPQLEINPLPFVPCNSQVRDYNCEEIVEIQSWGLSQRLKAVGCKNIIVGVSGGLDSTLALLVAHHAFSRLGFDTKGIKAVTMPADATSSRTFSNSRSLMSVLDTHALEIPIMKAVNRHFEDIGHDPSIRDAVYENSQARERTQILMDLANKYNGLVLGTGDMSELALGWCTYNGDHMSMYNVNAGVPKTLVKYLVRWFADNADEELKRVLYDILDTPISPELIPSDSNEEIAQKTEDLIGPYDLHDFFLFHVVRNGFSPSKIMFLGLQAFKGKYSGETIKKWLVNFYSRFFSQQFKRSCMPDGPKIGSVCLSPRGDWRMPSDAAAALWLNEAKSIET